MAVNENPALDDQQGITEEDRGASSAFVDEDGVEFMGSLAE